MIRTRLDNIELKDIELISDLEALGRTNYAGSFRIAKLHSLLAVAYQIQLRLGQTVPKSATEHRINRLTTRMIDTHIAAIKKRIVLIEGVNARKARKQRSDYALAELAIAAAPSINAKQSILSINQTPAPIRAAIARPVIEALKELNAPTIDEQYSSTISSIEALEATRAVVRPLTDTVKVIDTGDKIGTAEDWIGESK